MRNLIEWIAETHQKEFVKIKKQCPGIEARSPQDITEALEMYLFNNYSMLIERSAHGFRIFWDARGVFISGRYQFMDMVLKEALELTKWTPLKLINSFFLLSFL